MIIEGHDTSKQVFVIAEIGNNHEGSFDLAVEMIEKAALSGANAVKFQTILPEFLVSVSDQERIKRLKKFQFSYAQFEELKKIAVSQNVIFFSTPFDLKSASFLNTIQSVFKIASGDNNFYPLIDEVTSYGKPMIISTGLSDMGLLNNIYKRVTDKWNELSKAPGLAFLHCMTSYPVPDNEANLACIQELKIKFPDLTIGYSDHTTGIKAAQYAVAAGARIVEKHFTIDKNYSDFRDHQLSADPADMKAMIEGIKEIELMMGSAERLNDQCEKGMHEAARRSIVSITDLASNTVITKDHLTWVRPGNGLAPGSENLLIGKRTNKTIGAGSIITMNDIVSE